ncbi:vanadium-dependent haloperoxidase [Ciceribacter sp. L1K22]|uniref:vanadium-dependent haloperoxidase n=1 Tax=Ciceribacter sp. L1K22 TaxID=2820275 RepID=UPI001ABDCC28|nr:vanadium-dependent haloperoxidase [Ciceribacter sp. L1K22]MBO3758632.1 vanadium-dependent haloperoxidase [Ciceribacter sp. L1K22]
MQHFRRRVTAVFFAIAAILVVTQPALAERPATESVIRDWYRLVLELVRHTPTYSPPVASRAFAYLGVTGYEALASGNDAMVSLAGQLNALQPVPSRETGADYDEAVVLNAALQASATELFSNTGPTGQRALKRLGEKMTAAVSDGLAPDLLARSQEYGRAVAAHVLAWSADDGGATVENMGFPLEFALKEGPAHWVPTNLINQQQKPLLPRWGENRTFAMPDGKTCNLPPPPDYSEAEGSQFRHEAKEVYDAVNGLTDEHRAIARFWSDDPMLSPTPPGHWIVIALKVLGEENTDAAGHAELLARLGIGLADAFIGCWHSKFEYDLVRPVTYIRRVIDPKWEPLLITPPFPEYPSGHSTQSGAAAEVLTAFFGDNHAFTDNTHEKDNLPNRSFGSFWEAAEEAGISRLYGGIHFRAAIDLGLDQGRCIGEYATALKTRR